MPDNWFQIYVKASPDRNTAEAMKRVDELLAKVAPASFVAPDGIPVQENDGSWEIRLLDENSLTLVKRFLATHQRLQIVMIKHGDPKKQAIWENLVHKSFVAAGLTEVDEKDLESGTYTNAQIAMALINDPMKLVQLLMDVEHIGNQAEKRSILSFAVDIIEQ